MELHNSITAISYGVGILGSAGAIFAFLRYSNYRTTVALQNDNIKALQDQATILKAELDATKKAHADSMRAISNLEGKLESYKEIPLQQIADSMTKLASSNESILSILRTGLTMDNGLVVKPSQGQTATVKVTS